MKTGHGEYVHGYVETRNDMTPRDVGEIALYPANNGQGGWYFLSLQSGKRVLCNQWDDAVICQKVIDRVHYLADSEKQKIEYEKDDSMLFEWRQGQGAIEFNNNEPMMVNEDDEIPIVPELAEFHEDETIKMTDENPMNECETVE